TETTTDVGFRDLKRIVSGLQQEWICTSVDDFGMGYSSLNLIREVPWNVLKIDRCFLPSDEDEENSPTSLMYKHVVAMARDLGLECVTEGVETAKQVEILKKNHCQVAQGFFYDRPLPVEEFEKRLERPYYTQDVKEQDHG
ncbi:MAG: EAL domain-containing protein, partial [Lachnospiraceae bacterium]|nr:EAL domain-containing protein [Lachnospiraceae bacterium]